MSNFYSTVFSSKYLPFISKIFGWFISWLEGMSYAAWKKLLLRYTWFLGRDTQSSLYKPKKRKKMSRRSRKLLHSKMMMKNGSAQKDMLEIINQLDEHKFSDNQNDESMESNEEIQLELITMLKKFWERKHISKHIEATIPDHRNQELITYSKQTIIMAALSIFIFRLGSGNKYEEKSHDADEKYSKRNIAKFIDAPDDQVPVIKTIEKFLKNLEEQSVNDLMIAFFKDLQKSKFFRQNPEIMPGDFFLLAADLVHTHTYDHPHHVDEHGNNSCCYCLKRVYNKSTENEKNRWVHNTLVFSFVFFGGLKIPIYRHPIHFQQLNDTENSSDTKHKQECELVALKIALPLIREEFPRMKIVLLLDGLYANRPVIQLATSLRCGYIIVRKEGCLESLAKDCDGLAKSKNHRKNCVKRCKIVHEDCEVTQKYEWFNSMDLGNAKVGDLVTNVLRFSEVRAKGELTESYKGEWLFSWKLSSRNCQAAASQARLRWEEEDLFNTLKNRGFKLKHDYSRDPLSLSSWQGLSLFAFGIFELFRFSRKVKERYDMSQNGLAEKLLAQLLCRPTEELFSHKCLQVEIQFRYDFVIKLVEPTRNRFNHSKRALEPPNIAA